MAIKTWTELNEYVQEHFTENLDEDITAEHLRIILIDILDTTSANIVSGISAIRRGKLTVTTAGTQITFSTPFSDTNYLVIGNVRSGNRLIMHNEYSYTTNGFTVKSTINGTYSYVAIPL